MAPSGLRMDGEQTSPHQEALEEALTWPDLRLRPEELGVD